MNRSTPMRALATLLVLLLAACASAGGGAGGATPQEQVMRRAAERWQYLIDKQPDKAWEYLSKGVRSAKPQAEYAVEMKARPVKWLSVEPLEADCEGDRCDVHIKLVYEVAIPGMASEPMQTPSYLDERWIRQDGRWVHVPKEYL